MKPEMNICQSTEHTILENKETSNFCPSCSSLDEILGSKKIVLLGEQTHGEGTVFITKIKLIKHLHQNLGFNILTFESNFYDLYQAWKDIENGAAVDTTLVESIFGIWSIKSELTDLYNYIESTLETDHPLMVLGFEPQIYSKYTADNFTIDLEKYLKSEKINYDSKRFQHLQVNLRYLIGRNKKAFKKNDPTMDIQFLKDVQEQIKDKKDIKSCFWKQSIISFIWFLNQRDGVKNQSQRDFHMASNFDWIVDQYPEAKIIGWGATGHFIHNSEQINFKSPIIQLAGNYIRKTEMMGDFLKDSYGDEVYIVAFTAQQGFARPFNSLVKIKPSEAGSLEYELNKLPGESIFIDLDSNEHLWNLPSRPLGHKYIKTGLQQIADGVIFNKNINPPKTDYNMAHYLYPRNKFFKEKLEEENNSKPEINRWP